MLWVTPALMNSRSSSASATTDLRSVLPTRPAASCAGAIESCELFEAYESLAYALGTALGDPCIDEFYAFITKCNG